MPHRSATAFAVAATSIRVRIAGGGHALRQAVGGEHDVFIGLRLFGEHFLGECLDEQRMIVKRPHARELDARRQARLVAASMYFCTLSVENCGASGMPTMRRAPVASMSRIASAMNGRQLRMPTTTGMSRPSAASCACKRLALLEREVGQRRAAADRFPVVRHLLDELGRRLAAAANQAKVVGHLIDRLGCAVRHQQHRRVGRQRQACASL